MEGGDRWGYTSMTVVSIAASTIRCKDKSMRTDTEIRVHGLRALVEVLGAVEAEKFISLILREPFDYTKWQRHLWRDRNVADISKAAMESRSAKK